MHRLESNILHHAKKQREQRKFLELTRYSYKEIEIDEHSIYYFNNIEDHLKEHNEYFLTDYKTIEQFNKTEPHRIIIKLY
tara:strand:- start:165 stop:404 length:240 start_codon:yes stop_codon:yes gene_type:complete